MKKDEERKEAKKAEAEALRYLGLNKGQREARKKIGLELEKKKKLFQSKLNDKKKKKRPNEKKKKRVNEKKLKKRSSSSRSSTKR